MDALINGFLLIDKPADMSSFDIIRHLRRQTGIRSFGHAGTLDPFATGLMLIAVNKYTRLLSLLETSDKTYEAVLELGKQTSTGDSEGEIIATSGQQITVADLKPLLDVVLQLKALKPPRHSALKVNGKRAYDLARQNVKFELADRETRIYSFEILDFQFPFLTYRARVSKGTYIRSLSEWIAGQLQTCGYTHQLRRTAIGNLTLERANSLESITVETLPACLIKPLDILSHLNCVTIREEDLALLKRGNPIPYQDENQQDQKVQLLIMDEAGHCHGIGVCHHQQLHPKVNL
jgi:tRNA pseudouridine55 synthase